MRKVKKLTLLSLVLLLLFSLTGCMSQSKDLEKVVYNKALINVTLKSLEKKQVYRDIECYVNLNNGSKNIQIKLDQQTYDSLEKYQKLKSNMDSGNDIKLNIIYDTTENKIVAIAPAEAK